MSGFSRLLDKALDKVEDKLKDQLLKSGMKEQEAQAEAARVVELIGDFNFPGLLAYAAHSAPLKEKLGDEMMDKAAGAIAGELNKAAGAGGQFSEAEVRDALEVLLRSEGNPAEAASRPLKDEQVRERFLDIAVAELAKQGKLNLTPDEAREVARMLSSGEFFGDVADTTAVVAATVRELPIALVADTGGLLLRPTRLLVLTAAIARDLAGIPSAGVGLIKSVIAQLKGGRVRKTPVPMTHTFHVLYDTRSIQAVGKAVRSLIAPENRSVRAAIILYARAQGIPLEEKDLDQLHENVFTDNPKLDEALAAALTRATEMYGGEIEKLEDVLQGFERAFKA